MLQILDPLLISALALNLVAHVHWIVEVGESGRRGVVHIGYKLLLLVSLHLLGFVLDGITVQFLPPGMGQLRDRVPLLIV